MTGMNFEQFTEEVRAAHPGARVICATEQPLAVVVDGVTADPKPLLSAHQACWLRAERWAIKADGQDAALLTLDFPARANLTAALVIILGGTTVEEVVVLDEKGQAQLELVSSTPGEIVVTVKDKPVRLTIRVEEA